MHLASQVLEEPLELLRVAVGGGEEVRGVQLPVLDRLDLVDLGDQLAAKALDLAGDPDRVPALEATGEPIDLPEGPRGDRPGAITQLQREIDRAVARREPVLPHARVGTLEALSRTQLGDRRRGGCGLDRMSVQTRPDIRPGSPGHPRAASR